MLALTSHSFNNIASHVRVLLPCLKSACETAARHVVAATPPLSAHVARSQSCDISRFSAAKALGGGGHWTLASYSRSLGDVALGDVALGDDSRMTLESA